MSRILIIDDDIHIGNMLEELLTREGCQISRAYSGTEALLALSAAQPDLVLLDLMLPGLSGEEVLPRVQGVPVIVLSARVDVESKVSLLVGGAVDYITKPFDTKELLARVTVALRNGVPSADRILACGQLRLNPESRQVTVGDAEIRLTRTEFAILRLLMDNPSQVITKSALLDRIAGDTPDCTESSLKTHMSNLRKKLRDAGAGDCVESVWGIGFKMHFLDQI